jgi:hypothetical protein
MAIFPSTQKSVGQLTVIEVETNARVKCFVSKFVEHRNTTVLERKNTSRWYHPCLCALLDE